jgi:hypothetical protein
MSFTIHNDVEDIMEDQEELEAQEESNEMLNDAVRELETRLEAVRERQEHNFSLLEQQHDLQEARHEQLIHRHELEERLEAIRQVQEEEEEEPVKRYVKKHFFDIIINKVKEIQRRYPKRLLCGSVALMLYGVMDKRDGGDLDFAAYEKKIIPKEHLSLKCNKPYKHCLFLGSFVKKGEKIEGVNLQDLDQIIYWKKSYGRQKDKKDLQKYYENQFIKEDEFEVKNG